MPNIIDSLFIELGVDVSKFSADQRRALQKIQEFEAQTKRAANNARGGIKSVGDAFRDLAKETGIGQSADRIDNLAKKFKNLGMSMSVSGGAGSAVGGMAKGLGMLLSPTALGIAAVGALGLEMWDLEKSLTAANTAIDRQSQLSDMNAKSLWSWGEAAKTVGANPQDITGGISSLQETIAGMMVGADNATPQLVALARLGLHWNAKNGMNDAQVAEMFTKVHQKAAAQGYTNLGQLRALTRPIMNDSMFALATDPEFNPADLKKQIEARAPANLNKILNDSLKSQMQLGELSIDQDILKETAYGGTQGLMMSMVEILRSLLGYVEKIAQKLIGSKTGGIKDAFVGSDDATIDAILNSGKPTLPKSAEDRRDLAKKLLMGWGMSEMDAAAMAGNAMRESSMDPVAFGPGNHRGLFQLDKTRQGNYAKRSGYEIGSFSTDLYQQFVDQLRYQFDELHTKRFRPALDAMTKAQSLAGKTRAFMLLDEVVNDGSFAKRLEFATQALYGSRASSVHHNISHETHIGSLSVHTPSNDPHAHLLAIRNGIEKQPLFSPAAQGTIMLGTRAMVG